MITSFRPFQALHNLTVRHHVGGGVVKDACGPAREPAQLTAASAADRIRSDVRTSKRKCKQEPAGELDAGYMVCKFPNLRTHIKVSNTPTQVAAPVLCPPTQLFFEYSTLRLGIFLVANIMQVNECGHLRLLVIRIGPELPATASIYVYT
jgi:hypothetical protein